MAFAADAPITHQITLANGQTWCDDGMINGLFTQVNALRSKAGVAPLNVSALGMKDAEIRATQFATYMRTTQPGSPGFNPHVGYDTTAASLGYNIVGENLAYISTDPAYIVLAIWQDSLHLAAMLTSAANVMGVSCIYDGGTAYWTYEPGACTGSACSTGTTQATSTSPLDSEEWAFLTLINNFRAQNGVAPLQVSVALENSSKWMSADMATKNYISHTDSLGRSAGARLAAFGYTSSPWGENLAAGFSDAQATFSAFATACDADASGNCTYAHRNNMLGTGFHAIGIARAAGGSYGWYWTTDFGGYVEQSILPNSSGPTIASFTASPSSVTAGQSTVLSWSVSGASSIVIDNGVGDVSTLASKSVFPSQTTTYTLTAANNNGSSLSRVTITVTALNDTQAPTAPVLTSATAKTSTEVDLTWNASTDNVGVTGYRILRDGQVLATISGASLSYFDTTVSPSASYTYFVRALDAAGNQSPASNSIQVATPAPGVSAACAAAPTDAFIGCYYSNITLTGTPSFVRTDPQINFDWSGNVPDRAIRRGSFSVRWQGNFTFNQGTYTFSSVSSDGMRLYVDGTLILDRWIDQAVTLNTVQLTLSQGVHLLTVEYYEQTGWSVAHLTWQSSAPVVQVPTVLSFSAVPSTVTVGQPAVLSWSVSGASSMVIDNGVGDVSTLASKSVFPSQTTTYTLTAVNNNGSSLSRVTVTVTALNDTQAPTAPVLTSATAKTSTEVDLTWNASTDNVGVTGYRILRDGQVLATISGASLSYFDTTVSLSASYTYFVRALDAAGNQSPASNSIQVATPAPGVSAACAAVPTDAFIGCYYSNITLTGTPSFVRTDPQINFDWSGNVPDRAVRRGSFSVRWQGNFTFNQGTYTFSSVSSDGMRLYVDGTLVLDRWIDQAATLNTVQRTLSQGVHLLTVEYYEQTGWSVAHLTWQSSAPVVQVPTILSFSAVPSTVTVGQPTALTWSISGPATISIDNGVGDVSGTSSKSVVPGQTVTYTLTATNGAGSSTAHVTVTVNSTVDTQPPSPPTLVSAVARSSMEVDLTWTPSVDNVSVAGYQVFRNGSAIGSVRDLLWADAAVSPGTSYTYSIKAYDAAGNYSAASNSIPVTTPAAPVSSSTCPTTPVGAFTGCYYSNITLSGTPGLIRTDPQINFDWGGNPPDRSIGRTNFSARWQGSFDFAQGEYTFSAMTSDGMRLYIDGILTLDRWTDQVATQYTIKQTLSQGLHAITVEYYEHTGWSTAHLTWQKN